jgi:protein SCO1
MTRVSGSIIIGLLAISFGGVLWLMWAMTSKNELPVMGEPGHVAGAFSFYNQQGKLVTEKDVSNKITVVEYFFTSCTGICPVMNSNLVQVYQLFKDRNDFAILSHTVDPENDSVQVLASYAKKVKASSPNWEFLTGDKRKLYKAARQEYLLAVEDTVAAGSKDDFIHTAYVALLDRKRRIRGFYDATNKKSMEKLTNDIGSLLAE